MNTTIRLFEAYGDTPVLPFLTEKDYVNDIVQEIAEWVEVLADCSEEPDPIQLVYVVGRVQEYYKFLSDMDVNPSYNIFNAVKEILVRKSQDYNSDVINNPDFRLDDARVDYFPFGSYSYLQMLVVKAQRLYSIYNTGKSNFEGKGDTLIDLAAYLAFYFSYLIDYENVREIASEPGNSEDDLI